LTTRYDCKTVATSPLQHTLLLAHPFKFRKVFCFTALSENTVVLSDITLCSFYQTKWRNILKD